MLFLLLLTQEPVDILQRRCVACHGPEKSQGKLRLDSRAAALKGGAIVAGRGADSLLIQLLLETDPDARMPRKAPPLPDEEIQILRRWIDAGAPWPGEKARTHWAYVTPVRPVPPAVKRAGWIRNPIDRFILARLEKEGLSPAPEAEPATLLRRVSLDLTGLPPDVAEVDAFLADGDYERAVDRLLASPHYGEKWARPWLDLARYADSNGYERDRLRSMWKYRDWVIEALNVDMPFSQFTIEQLAGDLLPAPTLDQRVATGFHRNAMLNEEDGVDPEEARWNTLVERTAVTATVWLGSTLACAQCHAHKYDPFSQRDFYRLLAFFENCDEPIIDVLTPPRVVELRAEIERLEAELRRPDAAWEAERERVRASWEVLEVVDSGGLDVLPDGSLLARGTSTTYRVTVRARRGGITAFRLEALADPSLPGGGPGRAHNGDFVLSEIRAFAGADRLPLHTPVADFASKYAWIPLALDGKPETGWAIGPRVGRSHEARFETRAPAGELTFVLEHASPHPGHTLGRFRISALAEPVAALGDFPGHVARRERIKELRKEIDTLGVVRAWVFQEKAGGGRPTTWLRRRGAYLVKGEKVEADVPAVLPPLSGEPNRLGLARWLVDPKNPLTARVWVNRAWEQYFGRGLVETSDDFGAQGARPTDPELLDWLATEFIARGFGMKALHRTIVTSAAYRQARPPLRLEAEAVRDVALAAGGLLCRKLGGPSVFPPQPEGTWKIAAASERWVESVGDDRYRRGLYTFWRRSAPYPSFMTFDAPSREFCAPRRSRTTTPLQSLVTYNDPAFVEAAEALGRRIEKEGLATGFRLCVSRRPEPRELKVLEDLYAKTRSWTVVGQALLNLDETLSRD